MKFVKFMTTSNASIYVNPAQVGYVEAQDATKQGPRARIHYIWQRGWDVVCCDAEDVVKQLEEASVFLPR